MKFSGTLAFENDGGEDFPEKSREVEVLIHQARWLIRQALVADSRQGFRTFVRNSAWTLPPQIISCT